MARVRRRRSAFLAAIALLTLSSASPGSSGPRERAGGPTTQFATVGATLPSPASAVRRQLVTAGTRLATDRSRSGVRHGVLVVILLALVPRLFGLPGTALRTVRPVWPSLGRRRHSIALRGPPALRVA